jgi:hypothetical protein
LSNRTDAEEGSSEEITSKAGFLEIQVEITSSRLSFCDEYLAKNVLEMAADSEEMTSNTRY